MGLKNQFKTDPSLETNGITIDYGDAKILIARAGGANKKYARILEQKTKPFRRAIAVGAFDNDRSNLLLMQVYADTVILNWETNTGSEAEPVWTKGIDAEDAGMESQEDLLPVTPENILKVFINLNDLFFDIQQQAQIGSLFRVELNEAVAKNS